MRATWLLVSVIALAACGDDGPSGQPLTMAEGDEGCGQYCDYRVGCGDVEADCLAWCDGVVALIRGDAARTLLACYLEQDCDAAGESGCLAEAIDSLEPTDAYTTAHDACDALEARCDAPYACSATYYVLLSDPTLEALTACFDLACEDVEACVDDAIGNL